MKCTCIPVVLENCLLDSDFIPLDVDRWPFQYQQSGKQEPNQTVTVKGHGHIIISIAYIFKIIKIDLTGILFFLDSWGFIINGSTTLDCFNAACYADVFYGPFTTFKLTQDKDCDWTGMKFSPDGKLILISTNGQILRLIDAFQGTPLQTFMVKLETLQCALTA